MEIGKRQEVRLESQAAPKNNEGPCNLSSLRRYIPKGWTTVRGFSDLPETGSACFTSGSLVAQGKDESRRSGIRSRELRKEAVVKPKWET